MIQKKYDSASVNQSNDNGKISLSRNKFNPNHWADEIRSNSRIIFADGDFFIFNGKCYQYLTINELKYKIREATSWEAKANHTFEVIEALRIKSARDIATLNPRDLLCLNNGILSLVSGELQRHSEELFLANIVDINYDEDAKCPLWEKTLKEILPDDDSRILLQKFAGYSLTTDVSHQKCLFMQGDGSNGKSTVIEVVQALLGESNFSSLRVDDFSDKFAVVELKGKLANFSPENRTNKIKNEALLKGLIDGSHISADVKFRSRVAFKPFAKLWIASNPMLVSNDTSNGFIRRFLFLKFPVRFDYSSQGIDLNRASRIIKTEMSGVLNWSLEGLRLLNENGFEPFPQCHKDMLSETYSIINPVVGFIEGHMTVQPDSWVKLTDVYQEYRRYSYNYGYAPISYSQLKSELTTHAPYIRWTKPQNAYRCNGVTLCADSN